MLKVNIVIGSTDLNWVAGRWARELVARLPTYGVEAHINSIYDYDLTYHSIVYGPPDTARPVVGLFTHGDYRPKHFGPLYDGHIVLNWAMAAYLDDVGIHDYCVVKSPVDTDTYKLSRPLRFGVAGRTYADGRKGEHLIQHMVDAGYDVRAWGSGWPCPIVSDKLEDLPAFYRSLDFYVDTSSDEGGCVPAMEAAACGVPVISHTYGVTRTVIPYMHNNWPSLERTLANLTYTSGYDEWARAHADYFKLVIGRQ